MQEVILIIIFVAALGFMARKFYRDYKAENGCASSGCKACSPSEQKDIKLPGHLKGWFSVCCDFLTLINFKPYRVTYLGSKRLKTKYLQLNQI